MRPLHTFAFRHYIKLMLCAAALAAFLGSGLKPASGSRDTSTSLLGNTNDRASTRLQKENGASRQVTNPTTGRHNRIDLASRLIRPASFASPFAAALTATKTDNVGAPVDPGATIMYTIEITNTGDANATNVNLTDTVDPNVTLVAGSVKVAPIAVNDTYNTIGNVNINVPAPGLLGNDINPNGSGTLSIQSPPTTTTNGGTLSINATTGAFTYDPAVGFEGSDTFTYTLANSDTPGKTDTATVTISVSGMIWFINNNAGACSSSCDGRLSHPFTSIAAFQAVNNGSGSNPAAGDIIFLYSSGTNYTGPLTLLNTQKLIGQGAPDSILTITGLAAPSGTSMLPTTNGTDPVISGSNITAITLGQNNQLHGFTVGNTGATGIDILGTNIGSSPGLTVKDVTVNGSGQALDLAGGTIVSGSTFATIESTGGSAAEGVQLGTVGGSFTATTTNIVNPTGTGIDVQSSTVAAGGFNFGATTVNKGSTNGTGVNLNSNSGTFAFSSLTVTTSNGTGVSATSSGTVNVTTGSISATGGPALVVNPTALGMTFTSVSSTNSTTTGISLTSASGSLTITTTTITNPTGIGISVNTSSATLNFGNTTATLSGGTGVSLTTNTGPITFTTLNVNSPDANQRGLLATENSGTITINGAATLTGGTISTSGATAVEITKASGATPLNITLRTVSANGGSNGIVLSNTSGSFTVTGDGTSTANGSGGTIQNMNTGADGAVAGRGISLNNAQNISLTAVNLHDFNNFAIRGFSVTGFTLQRSVISGLNGNSGGAADEAAISFDNLLGSATISNTSIGHGFEFIVKVLNSSGTLNRLTMDSDSFGSNNATLGGDAVQVVASNTATVNVTVSNSTFTSAREDLFNAAATQTSSMDLVFRQNTLSNSHTPVLSTRTNVLLFSTSTGTVTYDISCNKTTGGNDGPAVAAAKGFPDAGSGGTMTGSIINNKIGAAGVANSGSISASGIFISSLRSGTHTTRIADNVIKHYDEAGIFMRANDGASTLNATITGNVTNEPDSVAFAGFHLDCGALATDSNIANIVVGDANVAALKNDFTAGDPFNATDVDILESGGSSVINLSKAGSASGSVNGVLNNDNLTPISIQTFGTINLVTTTPAAPPAVAGCVAPASLAPGGTITTQGKKDPGGKPEEDLAREVEGDLRAAWGEGSNPDAQQLRKEELAWFVQAAIERWKEAGISDEDLARIEAVTFELADLPSGQLANASGTRIQIDETGAGYGWFTDITPDTEFEFEVPVPGKEIQTTAVSPAHGKMDLLTVVMRQIGYVYLQGKDNVTTKLLPLMEPTLSPSIRRLPDLNRARRLTSAREMSGQSTGKVASTAEPQPKAEGAPGQSVSGSSTSLLELKPAIFSPGANLMPGSYERSARRTSYAPSAGSSISAASPMSGETVNLGPFTVPPGEKIVIMFSATVNDPFTGGSPQVSNQGTVTADGGISVLTDDPDVAGAANPTVTQINLPDVTVAVAPSSTPEDGATNLVYTFTRTGSTTAAITVNFSVGGTATFNTDYTQTGAATFTASTGTVTIPAGQASAEVTIDPTADAAFEADETVILTVTAGTGYEPGVPAAATGTIANDDTEVSVAVSPASTPEDGATNLVYTFTRQGLTAGALTVNFSVGGTATFSTDYTQTGAATFTPPTGTVTFGAGNTTATVTVDPTADTTVESDETVILTVTAGTGYTVGTPSVATGTISNDDADVSVAVSPASVLEDGATNLVYTFTRTGFTGAALTINFSVGGTATFSTDYTQTGAATFTTTTGTVTFTGTNTTATVTIDPTADATGETDETVILTVTSGTGYNPAAPTSATGTILNDDTSVSVAVSPTSVAEDGATNMVYTFTRTGDTSGSLLVNFSVGGTATLNTDYTQTGADSFTASTGTITITAGNASASITVDPAADSTVEPDETVILTVTAGTGYVPGPPNPATGTILNDDTEVTVAVSPASTLEDGAGNLVYTFTRTGVTTGALTVNFSVGGTATFATDYTQTGADTFTPSAGTVTIGAGNATATVTVDPSADTTVEPDETVILMVTSGTGYNIGVPDTATGTISNDDSDVTLTLTPASVGEDGSTNLVYTFTRSGVTTSPLTVNFSVGGTATFTNDYTQTGAATYGASSGTVTIASGNTTATVTLTPVNDVLVEGDETAVLTITAGSYGIGAPDTATGTITDNDTATVAFAVSSSNAPEQTTPHNVGVTLAITANGSGTPMLGRSVSVNVQDLGTGSATGGGTDYTFASPQTVTFNSGDAAQTNNVSIAIVNDSLSEGNETINLALNTLVDNTDGQVSLVSPTSDTVTIVDNDIDLKVTKAESADPVAAGGGPGNLTYTVKVKNVGLTVANGVMMSEMLTVPPGVTVDSVMANIGSVTGSSPSFTWNIGTLGVGVEGTLTAVLTVGPGTAAGPNVICDTATITASTENRVNTGDDSVTECTSVVAQADLEITGKTDTPDPACVQGNITYTIGFQNNGPGPGLSTTVTDAVPANTTFVSAMVTSGTGWTISAPAVGMTGNVVFSKASVAVGETATFQIVVNVTAGTIHGTVITNTATAASSLLDPTPGNNSKQAMTTVDQTPPTLACPANVSAVTNQNVCQQGGCATVSYTTPTAMDNCPGVQVVCSPPSGACMPTGSTTVTCTATDTAGNTASCSFSVTVFDVCLQDDSNPNTVLLFNSQTGAYKFCCGGTTYTGTGTVSVKGCIITLSHSEGDRRLSASIDKTQFKGIASLQSPPGVMKCSITDRDTRNNTCNCP
ncbi:MAG TPA: Calx-beta domain-containing protein [Blastocatellia bacterium]|nr:Calx-beta domain-containing protein [Blastocatellia bacterium]